MKVDRAAIEELVTRVNAALPHERGNVIGFIASGRGEGTSSVARAYAAGLASRLRRRVLLLEADGSFHSGLGFMHDLAANRPIDRRLHKLRGGAHFVALGDSDPAGPLWELVERRELWNELRRRFDHVVVDLPSSDRSRLGLTIAPHCDGVIVLLEAEKSRAPVVASLLAKLQAVRAPVLGMVLNKRRFHLPKFVYRWL